MPLYEYVCADCDSRFEELRPLGRMDEPATCPRGHSQARRVLSLFAALIRDALGETAHPRRLWLRWLRRLLRRELRL